MELWGLESRMGLPGDGFGLMQTLATSPTPNNATQTSAPTVPDVVEVHAPTSNFPTFDNHTHPVMISVDQAGHASFSNRRRPLSLFHNPPSNSPQFRENIAAVINALPQNRRSLPFTVTYSSASGNGTHVIRVNNPAAFSSSPTGGASGTNTPTGAVPTTNATSTQTSSTPTPAVNTASTASLPDPPQTLRDLRARAADASSQPPTRAQVQQAYREYRNSLNEFISNPANASQVSAARTRLSELGGEELDDIRSASEARTTQRQESRETRAQEQAAQTQERAVMMQTMSAFAGNMSAANTAMLTAGYMGVPRMGVSSFGDAGIPGFGGGFGMGGGFGAFGPGVNPAGFSGGAGSNSLSGLNSLGNYFNSPMGSMDNRAKKRALDMMIQQLLAAIMQGNVDMIKSALTIVNLKAKTTLIEASFHMVQAMRAYDEKMQQVTDQMGEIANSSNQNSQSAGNTTAQLQTLQQRSNQYSMTRQAISNFVRDIMSMVEEMSTLENSVYSKRDRDAQFYRWG